MSKITFRADDALVEELEAFDASKSEVMRDALRTYLDANAPETARRGSERAAIDGPREPSARSLGETIDDLVHARVNELVDRRLAARERESQSVDVTIALEGVDAGERKTAASAEVDGEPASLDRTAPPDANAAHQCSQCGERLGSDHVYCPNCGEKASKRAFCECGDEVRTDWSFCPSCGRRTPAADVLDSR